jgi:hypothetical protein
LQITSSSVYWGNRTTETRYGHGLHKQGSKERQRRYRGGIAKTWRYIAKGLSLDEAKALMEKKTGQKLYS